MAFVLLLILLIIFVRSKNTVINNEPSVKELIPQDVRENIAREIEQAAKEEPEPNVKKGLLKALTIAKSHSLATLAYPDIDKAGLAAPSVTTTAASASTVGKSEAMVQQIKPPQSNAITLLYVGAFLFVTAVVIFIAASVLGGGAKTFLTLCTALAFYGLGLWLHGASKQFKPAGQTFVAIGMVILPLAGVAAYNLVFAKEHALGIWCITSLVSFVAYVYALSELRTTLMGYMSVLSALSLVESAVLSAGLPLYYVSWTLALVSVVLAVVGKRKNLWPEQKEPLEVSAHIMLPAALLMAGINISHFGWWQFAAALVLAAGFYSYAAMDLMRSIEERASFVALTAVMLIATVPSVGAALHASLQANSIAVLVAACVVCVSSLVEPAAGRHPLYKHAFGAMGFVPFIAILPILGTPYIVLGLVLWLLTAGSLSYAQRSASWLLSSFLPILSLPLAVSSVLTQPISSIALAIIYTLMGTAAVGARKILAKHSHDVRTSISGLYAVALAIGWGFAVSHGVLAGSIVLIIDMVLLAMASYIEMEPTLFGAAYAGLYVAGAMALSTEPSNVGLFVCLLFGALALVGYGLAELVSERPRAKIIQNIAPLGLYAAAGSTFFTGTFNSTTPVILLVLAGLMTWYQAHKIQNTEVAAGAFLTFAASASWLFANMHVREVQVYAHLWAATWAAMYAWRVRAKDPTRAETYLVLALLSVTAPLGLQVLGNTGGGRGWFLVIEQLILMMVGMAINNKFVTKWGLIVAISAVIYQLRDLTFVVLGLVGLAVIAVAIWLLNRENKKL